MTINIANYRVYLGKYDIKKFAEDYSYVKEVCALVILSSKNNSHPHRLKV